jgi:hypothetical protein
VVSDADKLEYAVQALRRKYATDIPGLTTLANTVRDAVLAGESRVTVTGVSAEGGSGSGVLEFEAVLCGMACERLLRELSPDNVPAPVRRSLGHIVRFQ